MTKKILTLFSAHLGISSNWGEEGGRKRKENFIFFHTFFDVPLSS